MINVSKLNLNQLTAMLAANDRWGYFEDVIEDIEFEILDREERENASIA